MKNHRKGSTQTKYNDNLALVKGYYFPRISKLRLIMYPLLRCCYTVIENKYIEFELHFCIGYYVVATL